MGSVDQADQLLKPYSSGRKSLAWFKKLGLHFIDRMLLNAFILYKNQHPQSYKKKRLLDFIKEVSTGLLMKYSKAASEMLNQYERTRKRNPKEGRRPAPTMADQQPPVVAPVGPPPPMHQRIKKPPTGKKARPQVRCRECTHSTGKRKETSWICAGCPEQPGLCTPECFAAFHHRMQHTTVSAQVPAQVPAQVQAQVPIPVPVPVPMVSPVSGRTRGGRRKRRVTPSPVGSRTRGAKRRRAQRPSSPQSSSSSTSEPQEVETQPQEVETQPMPDLTANQFFPGTSTLVDAHPGSSTTGFTQLQPITPAPVPVAVVRPVTKKKKKEKKQGPRVAQRHPDGSYVLTTSEHESQDESGDQRQLNFDEF